MSTIKFVNPAITESQATPILSKPPRPFARKHKILKIELIYVPCYLFQVYVGAKQGNVNKEQIIVDGIQGEFAFFKGAEFSQACPVSGIQFEFRITGAKAEQIAIDEYNRHLLKLNLKKNVSAMIQSMQLIDQVYYPYWIGYFKRKESLDFDVIDGINGERQGSKLRSLFIKLVLEMAKKKNNEYRTRNFK